MQDILPSEDWDKVARSFNRLSRPVVRLAKQEQRPYPQQTGIA